MFLSSHALSRSILSLRAQLLLEQYILSLLATVGQAPPTNCASSLPETLTLVNELVRAPLLNQKGHGKMLIIRYVVLLSNQCLLICR